MQFNVIRYRKMRWKVVLSVLIVLLPTLVHGGPARPSIGEIGDSSLALAIIEYTGIGLASLAGFVLIL